MHPQRSIENIEVDVMEDVVRDTTKNDTAPVIWICPDLSLSCMGRTIRARSAGETASTEGLLCERATLLLQRLASSEGDMDIYMDVVEETP
jgi:hypothetical protein